MQETVQGKRDYNVRFGFDEAAVKKIAKECGSPSLKGCSDYLSFLRYHSKEKFFGFIVDDTAFLFGSFAKKHFRLAEIAVEQKNQKKGYGALMLSMLFEECIKRGIYAVTLRASKQEGAYLWYQRLGAKIVGEKGEDYEMRFEI